MVYSQWGIIVTALAFLGLGWYLLIAYTKPGKLTLRARILVSLAFGVAISAYHILVHLHLSTFASRFLDEASLFASIFLPAASVALAFLLKGARWAQAMLVSAGVVGSHYSIVSTHSAIQFLAMWGLMSVGIRSAIYVLNAAPARLLRCHEACRTGLAIAILVAMTMAMRCFTEVQAGIVMNGQLVSDDLLSFLAAQGLFLLYLYVVLSIRYQHTLFWRVLLAIMLAEIAIMYMLPPLVGSILPAWGIAVVDALLLSLFFLPVLLQQHQTSQQLVRKGKEMETALLSIQDGVIVCDEHGTIQHFNRSAQGITGLSREQAIGHPVAEIIQLVDETTGEAIPSPAMRCLAMRTSVEVTNHAVIRHVDGTVMPVEHTASPVFAEPGRLSGAILICRDVSQRRLQRQRQQQEQELTTLLNRFLKLGTDTLTMQQLLQTCLDGILNLSWLPVQPRGGIFLTRFEQLELVAQTGLGEQVRQNCAHIQFGYCLCGRAAQSQQIIFKSCLDQEHEFQHHGMVDHGHYSLPLIYQGETLGVLVLYLEHGHLFNQREQGFLTTLAQTVTHLLVRKQAHKALILSHQVLQHSHQGVMISDENNRIIEVNPAFSRITGYAAEEVIGQTPALLRSGQHDMAFYQHMWRAIHEQGKWEGEIWNKTKDGTVYPEWLNISTIKDESGHILRYVGIFTDLTQIRRAESDVTKLAYFDTLTGLPNRTQLDNSLTQLISRAKRNKQYLAVLFMDLDRFKGVNDTHGHQIGDHVLTEVGQRLKRILREGDVAGRWGGDEFVILLQAGSRKEIRAQACHVAEKVGEHLHKPIQCEDKTFNLGVSIGISIYPEDAQEAEQLLQYADMTMYQAKQQEAGSYRFFSQTLNIQITRRTQIEHALSRAIAQQELSLHFQPKVRIDTQEIVGFEALLRWHNEDLGSVSPAEFIPVAEESKLIVELDLWVLEQVCQQLAYWYSVGLCQHGEHIAINISPRYLQQAQFIEQITQQVTQFQIPPHSLQIEITETGLMQQESQVLDHLNALYEAGFSIAIDDFGTGYSSLARLKDFPIDVLKIDRSFIRDIVDDDNDRAIVAATINMAAALGIHICAEGIETQAQLQLLQQAGCEFGQGYFYGRPVPVFEAERWLEQGLDTPSSAD